MSIKSALINNVNKAKFFMSKNSPTILTISGVVLEVAAVVTAAYRTTKIGEINDAHAKNMDLIKKAQKAVKNDSTGELEYTENEADADKALVNTQRVIAYAKNYAIPGVLTIASISCILGAHRIISARYSGVVAFASSIAGEFNHYRERIRTEVKDGEKIDSDIMHNIKNTETVNEKGKKTKERKRDMTFDLSDTTRIFDKDNVNWDEYVPEMNVATIRTIEKRANDELRAKGHLFLNDVYNMLGFEDTSVGAVVGWSLDDKAKETYVDFGIFNGTDDPWDFEANEPWDGTTPLYLKFNVDGIIYDRIASV